VANITQSKEIEELFRRHLRDYHGIDTEQEFALGSIRQHLEGDQTIIPLSIFSNDRLSTLEAVVKYLRENEHLSNSKVAKILNRTPASVWITYRNAARKLAKTFALKRSGSGIPTSAFTAGLSPLESVAYHLHETSRMSYAKIGRLLNRDERTVWTACSRARKKL
jgi:DNA-binding CsgD family transcriptional regulator